MLNWQAGYNGAILERGRDCFKDGAVVGLCRGPQAWEALVVGTKLYRIGAGITAGRVVALRCNCPYYAKQESPCKHMAALFFALADRAGDVLQDDDAALSERLEALSSDDVEDMLQLAIDVNSTRCTALLLNRKGGGDAPAFSPDEFTLDDLPGDALSGRPRDAQGDNGPMKLLFPEQEGGA